MKVFLKERQSTWSGSPHPSAASYFLQVVGPSSPRKRIPKSYCLTRNNTADTFSINKHITESIVIIQKYNAALFNSNRHEIINQDLIKRLLVR